MQTITISQIVSFIFISFLSIIVLVRLLQVVKLIIKKKVSIKEFFKPSYRVVFTSIILLVLVSFLLQTFRVEICDLAIGENYTHYPCSYWDTGWPFVIEKAVCYSNLNRPCSNNDITYKINILGIIGNYSFWYILLCLFRRRK